jgi:hypothetical protein
VFKDSIQQLNDALAYICDIADEPGDAFGIYRLFLKELFSAIVYYEKPGCRPTECLGVGVTRGLNFNELLCWIHLLDCGRNRTYTRLERKMRKVFRYLRVKADPPYGIPDELMENRFLKIYWGGSNGQGQGGPLSRF